VHLVQERYKLLESKHDYVTSQRRHEIDSHTALIDVLGEVFKRGTVARNVVG